MVCNAPANKSINFFQEKKKKITDPKHLNDNVNATLILQKWKKLHTTMLFILTKLTCLVNLVKFTKMNEYDLTKYWLN